MTWIERALEATGTASVRRRRLPAEQVVWLVIALALYRHQSMLEVLATLDLSLPAASGRTVSKSAITQARQRLGAEPLGWLFAETGRAWSRQDAERYAWKGLSLWAMDGTIFRTPDSPENRAHFGAQRYSSGKIASYPQVRAVSLTAIPTHLVADLAFGAYGTNEMLYAKQLIPRIPDHSLTVFDKGFLSAEILLGLSLALCLLAGPGNADATQAKRSKANTGESAKKKGVSKVTYQRSTSEESPAERDRRMYRECKGLHNAGACRGYTR